MGVNISNLIFFIFSLSIYFLLYNLTHSKDSPSSQGITIFDQEEQDQQQDTETTFSKNTIKAMKLLKNKCREEIGEQTSEGAPRARVVSYDQVVGTVSNFIISLFISFIPSYFLKFLGQTTRCC